MISTMTNQPLKIKVGSYNPVKISAVEEILLEYSHLTPAEVKGIAVNSKVSDQPKSLNETIQGAINRARQTYEDCDYSFGIESGLMTVPQTKTGYMDISVCAIYDGREFHLGISSAFECPLKVTEYMIKGGLNMNEAFYKAGLTDNPQVGSTQGAVSILTKGRLTRKEYTKQAIRTALIHMEKN